MVKIGVGIIEAKVLDWGILLGAKIRFLVFNVI